MADQKKTEKVFCLNCGRKFGDDITVCPDDSGELVPLATEALLGTVFADKYLVESVLGKGGMSTVYKAKQTYMDRIVALKLLHPQLVSDPTSVQRFSQEAKAAASLSHPNIITVYDFGITAKGEAYLAMDYLVGSSLSAILDMSGPVPENEALDMFRQICRGLVHAHNKGIVHRDLKPANLVLTADDDGSVLVRIVDFGIAKILPGEGEVSQHLTKTGDIFGSPLYMSPEQWTASKLDYRSDIYSLGCVMYEVLTGMPPFAGDTPMDTMNLHLSEPAPPFRETNPHLKVSKELEQVVLTCLEKKVNHRYQSAHEVLHALPDSGGHAPVSSQTGTVIVKLNQMVESHQRKAGVVDAVATSKQKTVIDSRRPRKLRKIIQNTRARIGIIFSAGFLALILFLFFYPGPDEDPGSPAAKCYWQILMTFSNWATASQNFGLSENLMKTALRDVDSNKQTKNSPGGFNRRFDTMRSLNKLYELEGKTKEQEDLQAEMYVLYRQQYENRGKLLLEHLTETENYIKQLEAQGESVRTHMSDKRLNWSGSVTRIIAVARSLEEVYSFEMEYKLLDLAERVLTKLYGVRFHGLAPIKLERADFLMLLDRMDEIRARRLYEDAFAISGYCTKHKKMEFHDDLDYLRALLRLGQWQRDYGDPEEAGKTLRTALAMAEKNKQITPFELANFHISYSNWLEQTGKKEEALAEKHKAQKIGNTLDFTQNNPGLKQVTDQGNEDDD